MEADAFENQRRGHFRHNDDRDGQNDSERSRSGCRVVCGIYCLCTAAKVSPGVESSAKARRWFIVTLEEGKRERLREEESERVAPPSRSGELRSPSRTTHPSFVAPSSAVSLSPSVTTPFCQNDVPTKPVGGHWYRALPFVAFVTTSSPPTFRPSLEPRRVLRFPIFVISVDGKTSLVETLCERREKLLSFCLRARVKYTEFTSAWRWMDRSVERTIDRSALAVTSVFSRDESRDLSHLKRRKSQQRVTAIGGRASGSWDCVFRSKRNVRRHVHHYYQFDKQCIRTSQIFVDLRLRSPYQWQVLVGLHLFPMIGSFHFLFYWIQYLV